jgi:ABC-type antimicrobial peptide transport system permease subunit
MLMSRGASRMQIAFMGLGEALILVLVALPVGSMSGLGLARGLGTSRSFLAFGQQQPLPVYLAGMDWRLLGAVALACVSAYLVTTALTNRASIVLHEQHTTRPTNTHAVLRLLAILALGAVLAYAHSQLLQRGTLGRQSSGYTLDDPGNNPLLILTPTLFLTLSAVLGFVSFRLLISISSLFIGLLRSAVAQLAVVMLGWGHIGWGFRSLCCSCAWAWAFSMLRWRRAQMPGW